MDAAEKALTELDEHNAAFVREVKDEYPCLARLAMKLKKHDVQKCTSNADCGGTTPICGDKGWCVPCSTSAECVGTAGPTCCPASGACVNLASDASNCGSCGTACGDAQACSLGVCINAGTTLCFNGTVASHAQKACGVCASNCNTDTSVCTTFYGWTTTTCNAKNSNSQTGCSGAGIKCCIPTKGSGNLPPSVEYSSATGLCMATTPAG